MLRLSLIIAILAGLGALYFAHFNVSEKITTLQTDLADTQDRERLAQSEREKAIAAQTQAEEELDAALKELSQKTTALETLTAQLNVQQKRADDLSEQLTQVTAERNQANQELSRWRLTGYTPEQIEGLAQEITEVRDERNAIRTENEILSQRLSQLQARLARYEGPPKVELPEGLRGEVVAVDPKYDFVILNIGENQGVRENGELLVNRNGRLIGKLQVTRVQSDRSVANILPDWKRDEIMEGDKVLIY